MKICERIVDWVQIIDYKGTVRLCGWINNNVIGSLSQNTLDEFYHCEYSEILSNKFSHVNFSDYIVDDFNYFAFNITCCGYSDEF